MPIYEYQCARCGAVTEKERPMADRKKPLTCVECGGATELQISRSDILLRGECWTRDGFEDKKVK